MEALDQLLMACHCQSINLFVESFLKMVAKLLESEKPNLQILGTNSVSRSAAGDGSTLLPLLVPPHLCTVPGQETLLGKDEQRLPGRVCAVPSHVSHHA